MLVLVGVAAGNPTWIQAATPRLSLSADEDIVITRSQSGQTVKRRGTITQWLGQSITLQTNTRERIIDAADLVEFQTTWPDGYDQGESLIDARQFAQAIEPLNRALKSEARPWARRIILSRLIVCHQAMGDFEPATDAFLKISEEDPNHRFFHLIPLPWTSTLGNSTQIRRANQWIDSESVIEQLFGAAWLIGSDRQRAVARLKQLEQQEHREVAALARAQRWRIESVAADLKTVERWTSQIRTMPRCVRPGALLMLADAQARQGQTDAAAINLIRIVELYPEQYELNSVALYRCGDLRHNAGHPDQAKTLWSEIVARYPRSVWAQQAADKLDNLNHLDP